MADPRALQPCGTNAAYVRHRSRGEEPCEACREARKAYKRDAYRRKVGPRKVQPCGTPAAWLRHKAYGEDPCGPCIEAYREKAREVERRRRREAGVPERPRFGSVEERFWAKVDVGVCWLWTGSTNGNSYGRFSLDGRMVPAHRWAYEALVGPIPPGLQIDHLCRVPLCVNPDHLEPVSQADNKRRRWVARFA